MEQTLKFLVRTEGLFSFIPAALAFLLGAPYIIVLTFALLGVISFVILKRSCAKFTESLRRLNRTPIEALKEDGGLTDAEARTAWEEVNRL